MTPTTQGYALSQGDGKAIWFLGALATIKASSEQTHSAFALQEHEYAPGWNHHCTSISSRMRPSMCWKGLSPSGAGSRPGAFRQAPSPCCHEVLLMGSRWKGADRSKCSSSRSRGDQPALSTLWRRWVSLPRP